MSPITDTLTEMVARMPEAFVAWFLFGVLPVLVPATLATFVEARPSAKVQFTLSTAARLIGWPALLIALLVLPWFAFEMFPVPVLFDAYPASRSVLSGPLAVTHWLTRQSNWLVPLAWLAWVFVAAARLRKLWVVRQKAG